MSSAQDFSDQVQLSSAQENFDPVQLSSAKIFNGQAQLKKNFANLQLWSVSLYFLTYHNLIFKKSDFFCKKSKKFENKEAFERF